MDRFFVALASVCVSVAAALPTAARAAVPGVLVQLRPTAAQSPAPEDAGLSPVTGQSAHGTPREQAQAIWQRQHAQRAARLLRLAAEVGVPLKVHGAVGSAGSALRLDFERPLAGPALDAALRRLRLHPDVASAVPNVRLPRQQAVRVPNDPLFARQWHWQAPTGALPSALNLPATWAVATGLGSAPVVAVVDGGVRYNHPDLQGRLLPGHDFVSEADYANDGDGRDTDATDPGDWVSPADLRNPLFSDCDVVPSAWHGTAIAGQLVATADNGVGGAGLHWGAQVLPVRVAGKCGALLSDLLDGLRWAAGLPVEGAPPNPTPARVINLSYGGSGACDAAYQQTVDDVQAAGALLVVAAGNASSALTRPADCRGVLAVAAVRGDGAKAAYASYGPQVALAAPGGSGEAGAADEGLLTTTDTGLAGPVQPGHAGFVGSSFAAPLVVGTAALVWSARPDLAASDVADVLRNSARAHTQPTRWANCNPTAPAQGVCACTPQTCGAGLLDPLRAVQRAASATATPPVTTAPGAPAGATGGDEPGGGGHTAGVWGAALWLWCLAWGASAVLTRRRAAKPAAGPQATPR